MSQPRYYVVQTTLLGSARPAHIVLSTPSFLHAIFSYLQPGDITRNGRVCKRWFSIAMDVLWRKLDHICVFLSFLAPMVKRGNSSYYAEGPLRPRPWACFDRYSIRVRRLECTFDIWPSSPAWTRSSYHRRCSGLGCIIDGSVLDSVSESRPRDIIFPKLRHLRWTAPYRYCKLFLHPGLKSLTVPIYDDPDNPFKIDLNDLVSDILISAPNLTELHLQAGKAFLRFVHGEGSDRYISTPAPYTIRRVLNPVLALLDGLPCLQKVILPRFWFTSEVAVALSKKKALRRVDFTNGSGEGCGDPYDVLDFDCGGETSEAAQEATTDGGQESSSEILIVRTFLRLSFPSLTHLLFCTPFCNIPAFVSNLSSNAQRNIVQLRVSSPILESASTIQEALRSLVEKLRFLEDISLVGLRSADSEWAHILRDPEQSNGTSISAYRQQRSKRRGKRPARISGSELSRRLTFTNLRSLLQFKHLKAVDIRHHMPISFSEDDLDVFVRGISGNRSRTLEKVILGVDPCVLDIGVACTRGDGGISDEEDGDEDSRDNSHQPILGLHPTIRTFAKYCPELKELGIFVEERNDLDFEDEDRDYAADAAADDTLEFPEVQSLSLRETTPDGPPDRAARQQQAKPSLNWTPASTPQFASGLVELLYLAPSTSEPPPAQSSQRRKRKPQRNTASPRPPLSSLDQLAFGPSPIHNPSKVALFLSRFLSEKANITWGVSWGGDEKEGHNGFLRNKRKRWCRDRSRDADTDPESDTESESGNLSDVPTDILGEEDEEEEEDGTQPPTGALDALASNGPRSGSQGFRLCALHRNHLVPLGPSVSDGQAVVLRDTAPPASIAVPPSPSFTISAPRGPIVQGEIPPVVGIDGSTDPSITLRIHNGEKWKKVVELLPLLVRLRREERERLRSTWAQVKEVVSSGSTDGAQHGEVIKSDDRQNILEAWTDWCITA